MNHEVETLADPAAVAAAGAAFVARRARAAVAASGSFHFAVSGGHTPWAMFAELASQQVPWDAVVIYQVDERVAPPDDPDRNLAHLTRALGAAPALARARQLLWLVTGGDKKGPLAKLLAGDTTIPAGRVEAAASLVLADRAAT
jgi:6-phosphogluconolactonase/glucosamine-6-phosphate isomerase/deaminase